MSDPINEDIIEIAFEDGVRTTVEKTKDGKFSIIQRDTLDNHEITVATRDSLEQAHLEAEEMVRH